MARYFVETRAGGLPWTREGCNDRRDGEFVPYGSLDEAETAVDVRKVNGIGFDDPMWAEAEYRIVRFRKPGRPRRPKARKRARKMKVALDRVSGEVVFRTNLRDLRELLTSTGLHCYDRLDSLKKEGRREDVDYFRGLLDFSRGIERMLNSQLVPNLYADPLTVPRGASERRESAEASLRERRLFDSIFEQMMSEAAAKK